MRYVVILAALLSLQGDGEPTDTSPVCALRVDYSDVHAIIVLDYADCMRAIGATQQPRVYMASTPEEIQL